MNKDDQILLKHNGNVMQSSVVKSKQNRKSETKKWKSIKSNTESNVY